MNFNKVEELITDIQNGKMVILLDDEDRENEGDLVCASQLVTPEIINFMISKAKGLVCLTLDSKKCDELNLPMMTDSNKANHGTAFTVSIEAASGITTGISAADRSHTIRTAVAEESDQNDIVQPGHIFPLKAMDGGVLNRAGHTEAACDLSRLAGLEPSGVICEIMNDDGTMARRDDLMLFAAKHDLKIGTIADLIQYRAVKEKSITKEYEEFKNKMPESFCSSKLMKLLNYLCAFIMALTAILRIIEYKTSPHAMSKFYFVFSCYLILFAALLFAAER